MLCWVTGLILPGIPTFEHSRPRLGRQEDTEARAAAWAVADMHAPAVRQNDRLTDRQPEPVAGHVRLLCCRVAEEWLENAFAILDGNAWPLIFHPEFQFAAVRSPG
jgi:hypothetical protein